MKRTSSIGLCFLVCSALGVLAFASPGLVYQTFDPLVIASSSTSDVLYQVNVTGSPTSTSRKSSRNSSPGISHLFISG